VHPLRSAQQTSNDENASDAPSAGEREVRRRQRLLEARLGRTPRLGRAVRVLIGRVHRQTPLLTRDDLGHQVVTAAATCGRATLLTDFGDATGTGGSDSTTDISVGEGVAVTHEHRVQKSLAY
jgi:hypothetical protein